MKLRFRRAVWALAGAAVCFLATLPLLADSQARIVRLSEVQGDVQVDRQTGQDFEKAIPNLPITQGMLLQTGSDGRAEVEFEDGTVVRVAPDTALDFQQLSLSSSGDKISTLQVRNGTAFFDVRHKRDDQFTVAFAGRELPVTKTAHFRVELSPEDAKLAVFKGELWVKDERERVKVKKGEELWLAIADNRSHLAKSIVPGPYDQWDKRRTSYHQQYYDKASYGSYPYYGRGDLDFYGGWYSLPGYGQLWQPYTAGYGFNPFYNGYWWWYPGFGYTWISGYPWGWLPYRYGSWQFVPGWGWGWAPGPYWTSWNVVPSVVNPPVGFIVPTRPSVVRPNHPVVIVPPGRPVGVPGGINSTARPGWLNPRRARPPVMTVTPPAQVWQRPQNVSAAPARPQVAAPPVTVPAGRPASTVPFHPTMPSVQAPRSGNQFLPPGRMTARPSMPARSMPMPPHTQGPSSFRAPAAGGWHAPSGGGRPGMAPGRTSGGAASGGHSTAERSR